MKQQKLFYGFVIILICSVVGSVGQEASEHCHYDDVASHATKMVCAGITSEVDLEEALKSSNRFNISVLHIEQTSLRFIFQGSFNGTSFRTIEIKNSSILALSDGDLAFEGLEEHLRIFSIQNCSLASHWKWHQLRNLRSLEALRISDSDLDYVSEDLGSISASTLIQLEMYGNAITLLHEKAFSALKNVKQFLLDDNEIQYVKRSMFPDPGENIWTINLSYNMIQSLPHDMFENMDILQTIALSGNQLRTLDEKVFSKVWLKINIFQLIDVPLNCDCRIVWITKMSKHPLNMNAKCSTPERLKGVSVSLLRQQDIWC